MFEKLSPLNTVVYYSTIVGLLPSGGSRGAPPVDRRVPLGFYLSELRRPHDFVLVVDEDSDSVLPEVTSDNGVFRNNVNLRIKIQESVS